MNIPLLCATGFGPKNDKTMTVDLETSFPDLSQKGGIRHTGVSVCRQTSLWRPIHDYLLGDLLRLLPYRQRHGHRGGRFLRWRQRRGQGDIVNGFTDHEIEPLSRQLRYGDTCCAWCISPPSWLAPGRTTAQLTSPPPCSPSRAALFPLAYRGGVFLVYDALRCGSKSRR